MYYDTAYYKNRKQYHVVGIMSRLQTGNQQINVLFPAWTRGFKVPKLTLGPTQPSIQWIPGALCGGGMAGHEGSLLSCAKVKKKCSKTSHLLNSS